MKKSTDALTGLKENVIIGTLIPAGTGSDAYQKLSPSLPDAPEVSELGFMEKSSDIEESEDDSLPQQTWHDKGSCRPGSNEITH